MVFLVFQFPVVDRMKVLTTILGILSPVVFILFLNDDNELGVFLKAGYCFIFLRHKLSCKLWEFLLKYNKI